MRAAAGPSRVLLTESNAEPFMDGTTYGGRRSAACRRIAADSVASIRGGARHSAAVPYGARAAFAVSNIRPVLMRASG